MLRAYRGETTDVPPVAPELWYYYPAKLLGVDMIEFQREVPFYSALKHAFEHFGCEGWGAAFAANPLLAEVGTSTERRIDDDSLEVRTSYHYEGKEFTQVSRFQTDEPSWELERPVKNSKDDLRPWMDLLLKTDPSDYDYSQMQEGWEAVGDTYLLEAWLGVPFFDFFAGQLDGGFPSAIFDLVSPELEGYFVVLQHRYIEHIRRLIRAIVATTAFESFCIGCSWSCVSLLGADLWRRWDKPVITAAAEEAHRHGKLLHIHFHGRSADVLQDLGETGVDCVCPFERPPGGDIVGRKGLVAVRKALDDSVTMNGNVHTVETLIRGTADDVQREVREIKDVFAGSNRFIIGTGDQVGRETPEENIRAMIEEARR
jgi:hypothetical protein